MFPIAAAAGIASGLVGGIFGAGQVRKANKMLRNLHRPDYVIPGEVLQNQKNAQIAANTGLPSQQYAQAMQNISRQQNQALAGSQDRRGGLMTVAANQQYGNDAAVKLGVANANARTQNRQTLYGINNQVAGYRDKQFDLNQMQPYQDKYNYAQALKGSGNQNILGGIDKALGGAAGLLGGDAANGVTGLIGGGRTRRMSAGATNQPNYYNGYGPDSQYGSFENGY